MDQNQQVVLPGVEADLQQLGAFQHRLQIDHPQFQQLSELIPVVARLLEVVARLLSHRGSGWLVVVLEEQLRH